MRQYVIIFLFLLYSFTPYGKLVIGPFMNINGLPLTLQQKFWCIRLKNTSPLLRKDKKEMSSLRNLTRATHGPFFMGLAKVILP